MTCPETGSWFHKGKKIVNASDQTYEMTYENDKKGLYYCLGDNTKYYFYVQGKGK